MSAPESVFVVVLSRPAARVSEYFSLFSSLRLRTMNTGSATSRSAGFDPSRLIQEHQKSIWRYLRAIGCSTTEADDFTQETFLTVFERPFNDFSPKATSAYLRRVAYNLYVTHQRRARRVLPVENIEQFDADWRQWMDDRDGDDLTDALKQCLRHLSDRARQALDMRFRDRSRRTDIAAALNITEHGAKNLMQRAKQQLRKCIESKRR